MGDNIYFLDIPHYFVIYTKTVNEITEGVMH